MAFRVERDNACLVNLAYAHIEEVALYTSFSVVAQTNAIDFLFLLFSLASLWKLVEVVAVDLESEDHLIQFEAYSDVPELLLAGIAHRDHRKLFERFSKVMRRQIKDARHDLLVADRFVVHGNS